ncbi:Zinc finger BED domain-containing protein DAYSLEEPER [Rhynchospora pubera]|uniref:Zinc finger BED domain-containing protein DAYSLEEPER n=1 Tax=Rhynchospora pubera TaxID=906938 RepID=A0AAV8DTT4_9POAL|nr:Zinc finger BED domain-containing protein DAYSLEEPER [Rhynchospora pubera]
MVVILPLATICGLVYPMGNQRGTGNMRNHVKRGCQKIPPAKRHKPDALQRLLQAGRDEGGQPTITPWVFDQRRCRKSFAKCVVAHEYPFNCANHHFLKVFLSDVCPSFKLPSRSTIRLDCLNIYEEERLDLYELLGKLDCKVSFTSDLWSSKGRDRGFMCLTCHYIDDSWVLRKRVLNFIALPSPHTGRHISQAIYGKLVDWNLDKRIFCLVLDNSTANDVCVRDLLSTTPIKDVLPVDGQIFHMRCGCHILNLIVQDGLEVLSNEITKIRETMKYIRHSQARMEKFTLAASQVQAPNKKPAWDVQTRWNSTYLMLALSLELKQAISRYALLDPNSALYPKDKDWEHVEALVCHLKVFYDVTNKLSGTKYPTLNMFFPEYCEVYLTLIKMSTSPYAFIVNMSHEMLKKWDKYWKAGNVALAIACVLDPRCKLDVVEYYFKMLHPDECPRFMDNLRACLTQLFKEYFDAHSKDTQNQASTSTTSSAQMRSSDISDTRAGLQSFLSGKRNVDPTKTELEEYLSDALDGTSLDVDFDILAWWKLKAPKYPIMARLTRDILAVPISTVASESTFSTAGRTLSPTRSSLNDESLEALICAQDWLKASVTESGGSFGDVVWSSEPSESDDTICGNQP